MASCSYTFKRVESLEDLKEDRFSEFAPLDQPDSQDASQKHLQVYLRVRPLTTTERDNGESQDHVAVEPPDTVLLKVPRTSLSARPSDNVSVPQTAQRFKFSQVYGPETTQREMFDGTVKDLVRDVLGGGNSLVFTYGVTNAGKTFTFLGPEANAGILPRSLNVIFNSLEGHVYTRMTIKPLRCTEVTRLTEDQQNEEDTSKRNLFRLLSEGGQKSTASQSSSLGKTTLEGSTLTDGDGTVNEDSFSLNLGTHTKFSIWVSFCEIYNENIHDLLEPIPSGALRRNALRLSQDIEGNSFVKDLRWVPVINAEEAYKVMKLGKKNQSLSSTKLNILSSRSHSIFSIRLIRIEDIGIPHVQSISELTLCDLAGSERCAKTQNKGERLKEAGNINTSLLILGKCINSLRYNQQSKLPQHIPFRESKLTHYLQGFFCGLGKACMIVNINQCASMYDETLNVLKFSSVARKVVVLGTKTHKLSMIGNADRNNLLSLCGKSSLVGWESTLEDLQEADSDTEESMMEGTVQEVESGDVVVIKKEAYARQQALLEELIKERSRDRASEAHIREEVDKEYSTLFSEMQTDFDERLTKQKEIIEERAETRLEIFKNLVAKNAGQDEEDESISSVRASLERRVTELTEQLNEAQELLSVSTNEGQQSSKQLEDAKKSLESLKLKYADIVEVCHQKDQVNSMLKTTMDQQMEANTKDKLDLDAIKEEILHLRANCTCWRGKRTSSYKDSHKRLWEVQPNLEEQPPPKKGFVECDGGGEEMDEGSSELVEQCAETLQIVMEEETGLHVEDQVQDVMANLEVENCAHKEPLAALDEDKGEKERDHERNTLCKESRGLSEKLVAVEREVREQAERAERALEEISEKKALIESLTQEVTHLVQELGQVKEQLVQHQLTSGQELEQSKQKLSQQELTSKQELKQQLAQQKCISEQQMEQLKQKLNEAIAHKDAELEKRAQEILRFKETEKLNTDKVKSLSLDLERKDIDTSDLKEKLADLKKQMLQVQKEISSMQVEEKSLRQRLQDSERTKKQLWTDLANKDRTIHQLKTEKSADSKSDQSLQLYQKACKELQARECVIEDMRKAMAEQEETQAAQDQVLDAKIYENAALAEEVEKLTRILHCQDSGRNTETERPDQSDDFKLVNQHAAQAEETLKLSNEKHQADRKKWLEEKLVLIRQAKEAEDKRNQEMRKFADCRERHAQRQNQMEALTTQLNEKEQDLLKWRNERDTLVTALEVHLQELLFSNADKDKQIDRLRCNTASQTTEIVRDGELQGILSEREAEIVTLKEQLKAATKDSHKESAPTDRRETATQTEGDECSVKVSEKSLHQLVHGVRTARDSVSSQGSVGYPSVLDSSQISTEDGRTSRFPKPEMEISFSPLQPNRIGLKRHGEDPVTVKITRSTRKRKSTDMDKKKVCKNSKAKQKAPHEHTSQAEVDSENRRNTRTRVTPKLAVHQEELSPAGGSRELSSMRPQDSQSSVRSRKEGTLQKIGNFLQSSPTSLFRIRTKHMLGLVVGKTPETAMVIDDRPKLRKSKRKLYRPDISSPMDFPSHPIITQDQDERESDHIIIKRRLRKRTGK